MTFMQLIRSPSSASSVTLASTSSSGTNEKTSGSLTPPGLVPPASSEVTVSALRLIELTNRTSAVLKSQEAESVLRNDPIISVFRTFGNLNRFLVSAALSVVSYDEFPTVVADFAYKHDSQMVVIPLAAVEQETSADVTAGKSGASDHASFIAHSDYVRNVFIRSPVDVALFVDRGVTASPAVVTGQHLFLPFFGGPDDRLALSLVVQLCSNSSVTATVIRIEKIDHPMSPIEAEKSESKSPQNTVAIADTIYAYRDTETRLASETADNLVWDRFTNPTVTHTLTIAESLSRITFSKQSSEQPLNTIIDLATAELTKRAAAGRSLIVVVGRSRRMAVESHRIGLARLIAERGFLVNSEVSKTLGEVGAALAASGINAGLLVLQSHDT